MIDVNLLKDKVVFFGLNDDQLDRIAAAASKVSYKAGDVLFREGDTGDFLVILESGEAEVFKSTEEGGQTRIATLPEGAVIGEMTLVAIDTRSATVQAARDTEAVIVSNASLAKICKEDRELLISVLLNIARILSRRLRDTGMRFSYS